jgi:hypothetical protein
MEMTFGCGLDLVDFTLLPNYSLFGCELSLLLLCLFLQKNVYLGESPASMVTKFLQPPACNGTFLVAERSSVNCGLLPEGVAASLILMSSIGWTRSSLAWVDGDAEGPFSDEPGENGWSAAFYFSC